MIMEIFEATRHLFTCLPAASRVANDVEAGRSLPWTICRRSNWMMCFIVKATETKSKPEVAVFSARWFWLLSCCSSDPDLVTDEPAWLGGLLRGLSWKWRRE